MLTTQWGPARRLSGITGMAWADWWLAAGVAYLILLPEEARKLGHWGWWRFRTEPAALAPQP
jgi:hypothetical protein